MSKLIIVPKNEQEWHALRTQDITSTEISALFDMSPYATAFELWHRKREATPVVIEAEGRMLWGIRLQDVIARGVAEDYGVKVRRMTAYIRDPEARIGSSFDFEIVGLVDGNVGNAIAWSWGHVLRELYRQYGTGIMEIKNVDALVFRDQWTINDDRSIEAPDHIELQVQHQLEVSDRQWVALVVLVGGNTPKVIIRVRDREVGQAIRARVAKFWQSIAANEPPPPHYPDDAEFVCKLHGYAEPGKVFDGRSDVELVTLAQEYKRAADAEKRAKEDKEVAKARILERIGDAERALLEGFSVSAGIVGPCEVSYHRDGYRNFRLTAKKSATTTAKEAETA